MGNRRQVKVEYHQTPSCLGIKPCHQPRLGRKHIVEKCGLRKMSVPAEF